MRMRFLRYSSVVQTRWIRRFGRSFRRATIDWFSEWESPGRRVHHTVRPSDPCGHSTSRRTDSRTGEDGSTSRVADRRPSLPDDCRRCSRRSKDRCRGTATDSREPRALLAAADDHRQQSAVVESVTVAAAAEHANEPAEQCSALVQAFRGVDSDDGRRGRAPGHRSSDLNAFRKSFRWYAYSSGLPAELRCDSTMHACSSVLDTVHSRQNACTQLIVYSGIQQTAKNATIIDRFCVAFTSLLRAAPSARSFVGLSPTRRPPFKAAICLIWNARRTSVNVVVSVVVTVYRVIVVIKLC